jgi:hypothetical protein
MKEENLPSGPDLDAVAAEQEAKRSTNGDAEKHTPVCPYCATDPFAPGAIPFNAPNGVRLLIFFCSDCRKVVSAIILELPQRRVMPASPIIMPGREQ